MSSPTRQNLESQEWVALCQCAELVRRIFEDPHGVGLEEARNTYAALVAVRKELSRAHREVAVANGQ